MYWTAIQKTTNMYRQLVATCFAGVINIKIEKELKCNRYYGASCITL